VDDYFGEFMWRFGCLGRCRLKKIDLKQGCNQGCHWKGIFFLVLTFLECCSEFFEGKLDDLVVQVRSISTVKTKKT
jgi:hypothetical protein